MHQLSVHVTVCMCLLCDWLCAKIVGRSKFVDKKNTVLFFSFKIYLKPKQLIHSKYTLKLSKWCLRCSCTREILYFCGFFVFRSCKVASYFVSRWRMWKNEELVGFCRPICLLSPHITIAAVPQREKDLKFSQRALHTTDILHQRIWFNPKMGLLTIFLQKKRSYQWQNDGEEWWQFRDLKYFEILGIFQFYLNHIEQSECIMLV